MKLFKKLASFILAFAMVMAIAMPSVVMAADNYTITITPTTSDHTYEAYQIFEGKLSNDKLSDIKWGNAITEDGQTELKKEYSATDAADLAEKLSEFDTESEQIKAFAKKASKYLQNPTTAKAEGNTARITVNKAGYYLIKDEDASLDKKDETYTEFILKVVKNQTVAPKSSKPTSEKKVKDINDSEGTTMTDWQDSADWDIGDEVPFQLKGTVAADYDNYKVYKMTFHDRQSNGLTFDEASVKVYVNGNLVADRTKYEVVTEGLEDDCTFEVKFADLKQIPEVTASSTITVEYKSELNGNAIIGSEGNPNTMHMEFSNNPNDEQGGETGKTPDDKVIVFTYKTVVNKVNPDREPLEGANFTLKKRVGENKWVEKAVVKNTAGTTFTFEGLDDGVYRLEETETPEGYNTMNPNPLEFTISATHHVTDDNPQLLTLSGKVETGDVTFVDNLVDCSLTTNIVNKSGSSLPETGGMGTTVLYAAGTLMILAAAAFLVMKKKAESK
ncbi:isopeptide-forming domain-containing fimbrial protein [Catenibacterium mitsuokai]|uniref:isopeptide-forming domain-containing fimbrial protein n=1 Tax=Catenibacterium mitsuokai TaxID=100886 RepID=UPI003F918BCC